jgi:hypothetical protein
MDTDQNLSRYDVYKNTDDGKYHVMRKSGTSEPEPVVRLKN